MAATQHEEDAALAGGLARWLARHRDLADPVVGAVSRPSAGYSSETLFAEVTWTDGHGARIDRLVVRMAPSEAASFARVRPRPPVAGPDGRGGGRGPGGRARPRDRSRLARGAVHRHAQGGGPHRRGPGPPRPVAHRVGARPSVAAVYDGFLTTLAAIHRADPDSAPAVPRRDNGAELDYWEEYLVMVDARPAGPGPGQGPGLVSGAPAGRRARPRRCCGATSDSRTWCSTTTERPGPCSTGT